jgi:hypothetical protein
MLAMEDFDDRVIELRRSTLLPERCDLTAHDGRQDFDFLFGRWQVAHRRLNQRLAGCAEWTAFSGTQTAGPLLGGLGNFDDNVLDLPGGTYRAATFRAFDPERGLWSIWWLDGRHPSEIGTPMVGRFDDGTGTFYADESFDGRPIRVRFIWSRTLTPTPRWEQAFSADGSKTWETNWVMDFLRVA